MRSGHTVQVGNDLLSFHRQQEPIRDKHAFYFTETALTLQRQPDTRNNRLCGIVQSLKMDISWNMFALQSRIDGVISK